MNLKSPREAAELINRKDVTAFKIRRWAQEGQIPCLHVGNRVLVDVDALEAETAKTQIGTEELARLTGLKPSMIRRGAKEGWIPCERSGPHLRFDPAKVLEALTGKGNTNSKQ